VNLYSFRNLIARYSFLTLSHRYLILSIFYSPPFSSSSLISRMNLAYLRFSLVALDSQKQRYIFLCRCLNVFLKNVVSKWIKRLQLTFVNLFLDVIFEFISCYLFCSLLTLWTHLPFLGLRCSSHRGNWFLKCCKGCILSQFFHWIISSFLQISGGQIRNVSNRIDKKRYFRI